MNIESITMPAGEYWVGDPCYAIDAQEKWMEWLEAADYTNNDRSCFLLADLDGRPVLGISTAYGDGEYQGSDGNSYPVDAGLIGAVPVEVADVDAPFGMVKVTFAQDFKCSYDEDGGVINIGNISIETD